MGPDRQWISIFAVAIGYGALAVPLALRERAKPTGILLLTYYAALR